MKQTTSFLFSVFFILNAFVLRGQGWDKSYLSDTFTNITEAPNGDFLALSVGGSNLKLSRINKDGTFLWQKSYGLNAAIFMGTFIESVSDGSIFIFGRTNAAPSLDNFLMKIKPNGDSVWFKKFAIMGETTSMSKTKDNALILTQGLQNGVQSELLKVNFSGDIIWKRTYPPAQLFATVMSDGNIALLRNYQSRLILEKMNPAGELLWQREVSLTQTVWRIIATKDNGIAFKTIQIDSLKGFYKYDENGNKLWSIKDTNQFAIQIAPSYDGGLTALSPYVDSLSGNRINEFTKYDKNGILLWKHRINGLFGNEASALISLAPTSDNGFILSGGTNPNKARLVKTDSAGNVYPIWLHGKIYVDKNQNCEFNSATDKNLSSSIVKLKQTNNGDEFWGVSDANGQYEVNVNAANYDLINILPSDYFQSCTPQLNHTFSVSKPLDTIDFGVKTVIDCPYMRVDLSTPLIRRCLPNILTLHYCNQGTVTAQNARVEVKLDSLLEYISATRPLSNRNGQTLIFNLGNVAPLDCGDFSILARVKCGDSTRIGQTLCNEAHIFPDTICNPPSNWSGANVVVSGRCDQDSVRFLIKNTTAVQTSQLRSIVVEDEIVFLNESRSIAPNSSHTITLPANGHTWRLTQEQEPNNPRNTTVSAVVEGCRVGTNTFTTGFANDFPNTTNDPSVSTICMPIIGSHDPNEKLAFPEGFKNEHFIEQNTPIDYQIGFQNTGNDTAFTVVLRDTLNDALDISTIKMGVSSHPFTWDLLGKNMLRITFNSINLVDSFHNEVASHGFVKFRINQKKDVRLGTRIENQAAIYFDYNKPIFTNTTFHTVGKNILTVSVASVFDKKTTIQVSPNPFSDQATFELDPSVKTGIFELFDLNGKLLRHEKFENNRFEFHKKDLPTGIFIFKISTVDGRLIGQGKVVAQ